MVLKQKSALILCAIYAISVIGIALSMHFCGGKLADIALFSSKTSCKLCKSEPVDKKDDNCCKNTTVKIKITDSHQAELGIKLAKLFNVEAYLPSNISLILQPFSTQIFNYIENKAPPFVNRVSFQVLYCVFRN